MNSATSSAPKVFGPTGLRSIVAQTSLSTPSSPTDGEVIAEDAGMIDRPDRDVGDGALESGQGNIPVIDRQHAEVVTHRPTPSPDVLREQPALAR